MAVFNIFKNSELERNRLDAEYYDPKYDFIKKIALSKKWKPIRDCVELCEYGCSIKMNEDEVGYKIFRIDDLKDGFVIDHKMKYASISLNEFKKFKVQKNDVLFNRVNSEEFVGRTGIFKLEGNYMLASYLVRLRTNSFIKPDYLNVFLNSKYGRIFIKRFSRRAVNQVNVNAQELQSILIPILSMKIQQKISNMCDDAWTYYQDSNTQYQCAENMLKSELKINYDDFTSVSTYSQNMKKISENKRLDAEYYDPMYDQLIIKIKKNNPVEFLGDILELKKGIEVGSSEYCENGIPFVRVSNMTKFGIKYHPSEHISKDLHIKLKDGFEPQINEILISKDATPAIATVQRDHIDQIISGGVLRGLSKNNIDLDYLALVINSPIVQKQVERDASGSIIRHWKIEQIKNTIIPIIFHKKQQLIGDKIRKSSELRMKKNYLFKKAIEMIDREIEAQIR